MTFEISTIKKSDVLDHLMASLDKYIDTRSNLSLIQKLVFNMELCQKRIAVAQTLKNRLIQESKSDSTLSEPVPIRMIFRGREFIVDTGMLLKRAVLEAKSQNEDLTKNYKKSPGELNTILVDTLYKINSSNESLENVN